MSAPPLPFFLLALSSKQVSQEGEVVYAFDRDFVSSIRRRSWLQRLRPLWKKAVSGINYLTRVAFGTALIVSALVVWLGVIALMSSGRDDNRCVCVCAQQDHKQCALVGCSSLTSGQWVSVRSGSTELDVMVARHHQQQP